MAKQEKTKARPDYPNALLRLDTMAYAGTVLAEGKKEKYPLLLRSYHDFFASIPGLCVIGKDGKPQLPYVIADALGHAASTIRDGQIGDAAFIQTVKQYASEYHQTLQKTRISEILAYAKMRGYKGEDIPVVLKEAASDKRYKNLSLESIGKKAGKDEGAKTILQAVELVVKTILEAYIYPELAKRESRDLANVLRMPKPGARKGPKNLEEIAEDEAA